MACALLQSEAKCIICPECHSHVWQSVRTPRTYAAKAQPPRAQNSLARHGHIWFQGFICLPQLMALVPVWVEFYTTPRPIRDAGLEFGLKWKQREASSLWAMHGDGTFILFDCSWNANNKRQHERCIKKRELISLSSPMEDLGGAGTA